MKTKEKAIESTSGYEFGPDIIRILAVCMVFWLHFYLNNGFYSEDLNTSAMFVNLLIRTFSFCAVPLFLILTGYLKCGKELKKGYYKPLIRLLLSWFIISVICGIFKYLKNPDIWTFKELFLSLTKFELAQYSWYINMYFGIFLLSPFINAMWNTLATKKLHNSLLITLMAITTLAETINQIFVLLPSYWTYLWPFTCYFCGCYIKTYKPTISFKKGIFFISAFTLVIATATKFSAITAIGTGFNPGYGHILVLGLTTIIFITFYQLDCKKIYIKYIARKISTVVLEMYLISYIFDAYLFTIYPSSITPSFYIPRGLLHTLIVFIASFMTGWAVHCLVNASCDYIETKKINNKANNKLSFPQRLLTLIKKDRGRNTLYIYFLLTFGLLFILWRCSFGFANKDEAFYLTIPSRLCKGEALFADEWHVSQMSSLLLYPFMLLHNTLFKGFEGIILHFRYLYVVTQFIVSLFIYKRLRTYTNIGAGIAAFIFLIYAPYGVMALSYNSMGIQLLAISLVILTTAKKHRRVQSIIAGITFACSVLCCPYLVFAYLVFTISIFIMKIKKRSDKDIIPSEGYVYSVRNHLYFSVGCIIMLITFCGFVLSRSTIQQVVDALPLILADPEHTFAPITNITTSFIALTTFSTWLPVSYLIYLVLIISMLLDKQRASHRQIYWPFSIITTLCIMYFTNKDSFIINTSIWGINTLTIPAFILNKSKTTRKLFYELWLPGILYCVCLLFSSNQGFLAIQSGSIVANIASILILIETTKAISQDTTTAKNMVYVSASILLALQLFSVCYMRYENVFAEQGIANQTTMLENGPQKGIIVSPEKYISYTSINDEINQILTSENKTYAILTEKCWYYTLVDNEINTYSAWLSGITPDNLIRLSNYYKTHINIKPEMLILDRFSSQDYQAIERILGYKLAYSTTDFFILYN